MSEANYYERPVLLDREKHRKLRVKPSRDFSFARKSNSVLVTAQEFPEATKEFPVVFTKAGSRFVPVVMMGLRRQENLYVDDKNQWTAGYIPAFLRRYPFVLAQLNSPQLALCIDEGYPGFNETEGEALFDEKGENTPFLKNAIDFLNMYQQHFARTEAFCKDVQEADLLREMSAKADLKDGRSFTVQGLYTVDEAKLMALPDATVLKLFRSGEMHLISMHLASLSNMNKLVKAIAERPAGVGSAPKPQA